MRRVSASIVAQWMYATLSTAGVLGTFGAGCSTGQRGRTTQADQVTRQSANLSSASCQGYHVIALEPPESRCDGMPGLHGRWVGEPVSSIAGAVYCAYGWVSDAAPNTPKSSALPGSARMTQASPANSTSAGTLSSVPQLPARLVAARPPKVPQTPPNDTPSAVPDEQQRPQQLSPYPPDHAALKGLKQVEIDCPVLASMSGVGPNDPLWPLTQLKTHRQQTGWIEKLPPSKARVRVAVIDSAAIPYNPPAAPASHDTYGHGRAMGRVIADLACPLDGASGCPADLVNYLALPLLTPAQSDYAHGGFYGTRGQLARAISRAVSTWRAETTKDGPARLVLNLSLGWDGSHGGSFRSSYRELDLASQAVYAALAHASCSGALSVASAGNSSSPTDSGPMYPAGWEATPAPDQKLCEAYGWREPPNALPVRGTESYQPLVYAVGGVDAADQPLTTSRPGAQPRLVGHALAVAATDPLYGGWTATMSGTSLAAAVGSGVAATAWAYQPERSAAELMEMIYKTSVELRPAVATTEHCLPVFGPCSNYPVRRLSACSTLAYVVSSSPAALGCQTVAAEAGQAQTPGPPDTTAYAVLPNATDCGPGGCTAPAATPKGQKPWVGPQPGYPTCTSCFVLTSLSTVFVSLKPGTETTLKKLYVRAMSNSSMYEIQHPGTQYPITFAAPIPGIAGIRHAELIAYHSAGTTSVLVGIQEPLAVY